MAAAVLTVHCQLHWPVHHHIVILGQVSNVNHDMRRGWETHTHITLCHTVSHCLTQLIPPSNTDISSESETDPNGLVIVQVTV